MAKVPYLKIWFSLSFLHLLKIIRIYQKAPLLPLSTNLDPTSILSELKICFDTECCRFLNSLSTSSSCSSIMNISKEQVDKYDSDTLIFNDAQSINVEFMSSDKIEYFWQSVDLQKVFLIKQLYHSYTA